MTPPEVTAPTAVLVGRKRGNQGPLYPETARRLVAGRLYTSPALDTIIRFGYQQRFSRASSSFADYSRRFAYYSGLIDCTPPSRLERPFHYQLNRIQIIFSILLEAVCKGLSIRYGSRIILADQFSTGPILAYESSSSIIQLKSLPIFLLVFFGLTEWCTQFHHHRRYSLAAFPSIKVRIIL